MGARSTFSRDARGRLYARTVLSCVQPSPVFLQHVAVIGGRDIAHPDVVTACVPGRLNIWQGEVTPPAPLPAGPLTLRTQVVGWDQVSSEQVAGATSVTVTPVLRRSLVLPGR